MIKTVCNYEMQLPHHAKSPTGPFRIKFSNAGFLTVVLTGNGSPRTKALSSLSFKGPAGRSPGSRVAVRMRRIALSGQACSRRTIFAGAESKLPQSALCAVQPSFGSKYCRVIKAITAHGDVVDQKLGPHREPVALKFEILDKHLLRNKEHSRPLSDDFFDRGTCVG